MLFVVFVSLGEAIWSPRWYDYSMSVAPEVSGSPEQPFGWRVCVLSRTCIISRHYRRDTGATVAVGLLAHAIGAVLVDLYVFDNWSVNRTCVDCCGRCSQL